jgi:hypothetical protein
MQIGNVDGTNAVFVSGKVVYFEPAVIPGAGNGIASLVVWTAAAGTVDLMPAAPIPALSPANGNGLADVSPDSSQVLYFATQDGLTATLTVTTPDGKTQVPLLANIDLGESSGCRPFARFAGPNVVASYCLAGGASVDAGEPVVDAGAPVVVDSGVPVVDSGVPVVDSGVPRPDSGVPVVDSGVPRPDSGAGVDAAAPDAGALRDAGAVRDATVSPDAAPDAAVADSGPSRDASGRDARAADTGAGGGPPDDAAITDGPATDGERVRVVRMAETPGDLDASPGSTPAAIATFTYPGFTQNVLVASTPSRFAIDPSGNHVLVTGPSGAVLYPVATGAGVAFDTAALAGVFTRDGANVVYVTRATALKRSPVVGPAPRTLVVSGLGGLFGLSPDQTWALAYRTLASGGQTSDLLLAPASMAGAARPLTISTGAAIFGDAFTADSRSVMYFDHLASNGGDFYVASVSGTSPTYLASNAWVAAATSGSKGLVTGQCPTCSASSATGTADLLAFDANDPTSVKTLVSQIYASFYLTSDRNKVVYSWTCSHDDRAGVYALPVP